MTHTTTLSTIPVPVLVEYNGTDILKMTDLDTGDAICPDLLGEMDASLLYRELDEAWTERNNHCDLEQEYKNV